MSQPILGQLDLFPFNFTPTGWLPCTGQLLEIKQYMALFALIGTNFGGDGKTTFGLPNLQGKAPAASLQYFISVAGNFPQRD